MGLGGLLGAKTEQCHEKPVFWGHLGAVSGPSWGRLGAWIAVLGRLGTLLSRLEIDVKMDQNMKSTWEGILASIFNGFCWIWGAKLGGKIEPRGIKNGIDKNGEK